MTALIGIVMGSAVLARGAAPPESPGVAARRGRGKR